jgi:hypothetical protein
MSESITAIRQRPSTSPIRVSPASLPCRAPSSVLELAPVWLLEDAPLAVSSWPEPVVERVLARAALFSSPEPVAEQVPAMPRRAVPGQALAPEPASP